MNWTIEFTTDLFNSTESKQHFINERGFGEDLIGWVVERFDDPTFTFEEPFQEDWGWATIVRKSSATFWIGAGIMDESIGAVPARWLLMVDKKRRFPIFRLRRPPSLGLLVNKLEELLRNEPRITAIERY